MVFLALTYILLSPDMKHVMTGSASAWRQAHSFDRDEDLLWDVTGSTDTFF